LIRENDGFKHKLTQPGDHRRGKKDDIRDIPPNQKLTANLERDKKVSKGENGFSENGKLSQDARPGWWLV